MLFEDIPYLEQMQHEHDQFASLLQSQGCTIWYIEQMLEHVLTDLQVRDTAISHLITSAQIHEPSLRESIKAYLTDLDSHPLASCCITGVLKAEIDDTVRHKTLSYYIRNTYPYYIPPIPNLYFTRDPATVIGAGIAVHTMKNDARRRENWLLSLLASHHPLFSETVHYHDYSDGSSIEGGDILLLNEHCAAVGSSARTGTWAIESFARRMMQPVEQGGQGLSEVLVIQIPYTRAYMHLDTVFTMVDRDAFSIYGGIEPTLRVFSLQLSRGDQLQIREEVSLQRALARVLHVPSVRLISSGGPDRTVAAREQWNDSTNTLAIAPGTVITYQRNTVSNEMLEREGVTVLPIRGSELVRGRGGPRCMSMPLLREAVEFS
jgi:arginine deiminase